MVDIDHGQSTVGILYQRQRIALVDSGLCAGEPTILQYPSLGTIGWIENIKSSLLRLHKPILSIHTPRISSESNQICGD